MSPKKDVINNNILLNLNLQSDIDVPSLNLVLANDKTITGLSLGYSLIPFSTPRNKIKLDKILELIKGIRENKLCNITSLDLSNNHLGRIILNPPALDTEHFKLVQWTVVPLFTAISKFINTALYYYDPSNNPAYTIKPPCSLIKYLSDSITQSKMQNLTKLYLSNIEMSDYELEDFCEAIVENELPNLKVLDLSTNKITCVGIETIANIIKTQKLSNLMKIDLSSNYISTLGGVKLLRAFESQEQSQIKIIKLSNNFIEDAATNDIISAFIKLPHLLILTLHGENFSQEAVKKIAEQLERREDKKYDCQNICHKETPPDVLLNSEVIAAESENRAKELELITAKLQIKTKPTTIIVTDENREENISLSRCSSFLDLAEQEDVLDHDNNDIPKTIYLTLVNRKNSLDSVASDEYKFVDMHRKYSLNMPISPREEVIRTYSLSELTTSQNLIGEETDETSDSDM